MSKQPTELIRLVEVKRRTGLPTSTLYKLMNDGTFPRQVQISARAVGWVADDVSRWIKDRIAARDAKVMS